MEKPKTGQDTLRPAWRWMSERGLLLATGDSTLLRFAHLTSQNFVEVEDVIPADESVLLILRPGASVSPALWAAVAAPVGAQPAPTGMTHEIAVEYGGPAGPDLVTLAGQAGMDVAAYVAQHAAEEYTVAFLGFQPGFPYLHGLPPALHAPRRTSPRLMVPAGSVAVGGKYTGIYPVSGPGGWHVIGRTSISLFDPQRAAPALLVPGDRVRFIPT